MTKHILVRPGLTAVAAVLALSATPAFAQSTETAQAPTSQPVIAPASPTITPDAPAEAPPQAPVEATANLSAPVDATPAPAPTAMATQSPVVVHQPDAADIAPSAKSKPITRSAASSITRTTTVASTPAPTPKVEAVSAVAPIVPTVTRDPVVPASTATTTTRSTVSTQADETGLIAGLGGAAVLVLAGGAFVIARRRRHEDESVWETENDVLVPASFAAEPARYTPKPVAHVVPMSMTAESPLPDGFDVARYGPHTRAAYAGPTAENPFLSLRKRLKRASFYDKRLRETGEYDSAETYQAPEAKPEQQSIFGSRLADRLNFRPAKAPRPSFRPATA